MKVITETKTTRPRIKPAGRIVYTTDRYMSPSRISSLNREKENIIRKYKLKN